MIDDDKRKRIRKEQLKQTKKVFPDFQVDNDSDSDE